MTFINRPASRINNTIPFKQAIKGGSLLKQKLPNNPIFHPFHNFKGKTLIRTKST